MEGRAPILGLDTGGSSSVMQRRHTRFPRMAATAGVWSKVMTMAPTLPIYTASVVTGGETTDMFPSPLSGAAAGNEQRFVK